MYNLRGIKERYHMYDDDYYAGNFVVSFDPTSNVIKTLYLYDLVVDLENQKPKNNIKRYEKTVVSDDAVVKAMYPFFYSLLYASPDKDYDEQPEEIRDCGVSKVSIRVIGDAEFIDTGRKVYYGRSLKVSNLFFDREVIDYILRKRVKDTHVLDVEPYVSKLYEEPPSFITKSFGML
jgi:hypothetical protein